MSETRTKESTIKVEAIRSTENREQKIASFRAAVELTSDAVRVVSVTAVDALKASARFMGVATKEENLSNPFDNIDAPVWSEKDIPPFILNTAYDYCEALTIREAANFYHSFKYLPDEQRRAMCAYYAFCRRADDIADGDYRDLFPGSSGPKDEEALEYIDRIEEMIQRVPVVDRTSFIDKMSQLFFFRKKLSTAYNDLVSTDPIFLALKDTVQKYHIPRIHLDDLIAGMEDDFFQDRYETFEDLYRYCYRVASTVGLVCIDIYGYENPKAREHAEAWGVFMQLVNILRDVQEDADRGRVYLPIEDLARHGIQPEDVLEGRLKEHPGWEPFVTEFIERIEVYRDRALDLLPMLKPKMRFSPAIMMGFYRSILKKIRRNDGDVFSQRVKLNKVEKLTLALSIYIRHRFLTFF
ncbi:MAG TPA: phytoene/squalene synthase family protein [Candidatus Thalassarchaeaceae archaeon]|nr:MAG TPA: phytoene/squalene synthase family protein [Candidatus Poseidoniales archaeon]HIH84563.1 phytoene/squalene synthase family protein [Candidatus Thalassarchaeaceae archaeon]